MRINCDRSALLQAVEAAARSAKAKDAAPIVACILIRTLDGGRLELTATDTITRTSTILSAAIGARGSICVNASALLDAVDAMPRGTLDLSAAPPTLTVKGGRRTIELPTLSADDFPAAPPTPKAWHSISARVLRDLFRRTAFGMSTDTSRAHIACARLEAANGELQAIATNGHILAYAKAKSDADLTVSIPARLVREIEKLADASETATLELGVEASVIGVRIGDTTVLSAMIDAAFPAWQQVVPARGPNRLRVTRGSLIESLRAVSRLSSDRTSGVVFALRPGELELRSDNPDRGKGNDVLDAELDGNEMRVGINARYVLETLGAIDDEDVFLETSGELDPVVIRPAEADGQFCVLMPQRI